MNKDLKNIIIKSIKELIEASASQKNLKKFKKTHKNKIHFIPIKYRVFGGILQSLNIKFGNFIEKLLYNIIGKEEHLEIIKEYSHTKTKNNVFCDKITNALIDEYISNQQIGNNNLKVKENFENLLNKIYENKDNEDLLKITHDIDVLFRDKRANKIYYMEVKYNDDHDTGKFVNLNEKILKTYSGLIKNLKIEKKEEFIPILFYFNETIRWTNSYLPQETNILRGREFFNKFTNINFQELDDYFKKIGEDEDIIKIFDEILINCQD